MAVDLGIGDDFGIALGDGHEDQHAGAARRRVQVLRQKLLQRAPMRQIVLDSARRQRQPEGRDS